MTDQIGPAVTKRFQISKAQQYTLLEVLVASLVLGACLVLSIFLIKYIKFNTVIITEKNQAISNYDQTIRNVGICVDQDRNGRLSDEELKNCNPSEVSLDQVVGSLRYNVLSLMAQNGDLESVARQRKENCYDAEGKKINFNDLYEASTDETERGRYLQSSKICSALRVIPDALPAQKNTEALMASLNQIFILTGWEPERLTPRDDLVISEIEGLDVIPVTLQVEGTDQTVLSALDNIERSIRTFDITTATVEWTDGGLNLRASANAYYMLEMPEIEAMKTVYADEKKNKRANSGSKIDQAKQTVQEVTN